MKTYCNTSLYAILIIEKKVYRKQQKNDVSKKKVTKENEVANDCGNIRLFVRTQKNRYKLSHITWKSHLLGVAISKILIQSNIDIFNINYEQNNSRITLYELHFMDELNEMSLF